MSRQLDTRRAPNTANANNRGVPTKRLTQRDMDSSCHRLSRVPQKFSTSKAIQSEKSEPFAVSYFKNNPEAASDIRPPDEKLQEIELALNNDDLEPSEKFSLLVQQKALRFISFGENSPDACRSMIAIGQFYNQQKRPESAIRHLEQAKKLEKTCEITENESVILAIELAEAHVTYRTAKHTREAAEALQDHCDTPIEDTRLRSRRELVKARILNQQNRHDMAIQPYHDAIQGYVEVTPGLTEELGHLYLEAADSAEQAKNNDAARTYYQNAHRVFQDIGDEKTLRFIEEKIQSERPESENNRKDDGPQDADAHPPSGPPEEPNTSNIVNESTEEHVDEDN